MGLSNVNIPIGPLLPPVNEYTCIVPMTYVPEDNLTYINNMELDLVECKNIPLNTSADFWNCNICGSDERYEQPVIEGDTFRIQVPITNNTYKNYYAYLFDSNNELIEDTDGIEQNVTTDAYGNKYLNIQLGSDNIPASCFYVKILGFAEDFDTEVLGDCIGIKLAAGRGQKEAEILCMIEQQEEYGEFYSELYRKTTADCEETLLMEGEYPGYDCKGNFYGEPETGTDIHTLKIRIPGTVERTEYNFEETIVFNSKRKAKQIDTFLFRTYKLPPYVAEQVALIFNSKTITIDGVVYTGASKLIKNFEDGNMWILSTTLKRECDEIDFIC